jgi:hypothetical protein
MTTAPAPAPAPTTYRVTQVHGLWTDPTQAQAGYHTERVAVVRTVGARGGSPAEWLVFFNRRGVLDYAQRDDRPGICVNPRGVPDVVSQAAHRVWMTSPSWVPARPLAARAA